MTEFEFLAALRKNVADPFEVTSMDPMSLEFLNTFNVIPLVERHPTFRNYLEQMGSHAPNNFIFGSESRLPFFHPGASKIIEARVAAVFTNARAMLRDSSPWTIVNNEIVDLPIPVYNYSVVDNDGGDVRSLFTLTCFTLDLFKKRGVSNAFVNLSKNYNPNRANHCVRLVNKFVCPSNKLVCYSFLTIKADADPTKKDPNQALLNIWKRHMELTNLWVAEDALDGCAENGVYTPMYFELGGIPFLLNSLLFKQMGFKVSDSGRVSILLKDRDSVCPEVTLTSYGLSAGISFVSTYTSRFCVDKDLASLSSSVLNCVSKGFDFSFLGLVFQQGLQKWFAAENYNTRLPLQLEMIKDLILRGAWHFHKVYDPEALPFRKELTKMLETNSQTHPFFKGVRESINTTKLKNIFGRIEKKYTPEQIQEFVEKGEIEKVLARQPFAEKLGLGL